RNDVTRTPLRQRERVPVAIGQALRISAFSTIWSSIASAASIAIGVAEASLTLTAFGVVQVFDFVSGVALVVLFRGGPLAARLERAVLQVVAAGLLVLGVMTAFFSVIHLYKGHAPSASPTSLALALVSCVALAMLAIKKRDIALRLQHRALRADANL